MPKLQIIEITTGRTREIQYCDGEGKLLAVMPYAKSSPVGHLVDALVKHLEVQYEMYPPDPVTKISKATHGRYDSR